MTIGSARLSATRGCTGVERCRLPAEFLNDGLCITVVFIFLYSDVDCYRLRQELQRSLQIRSCSRKSPAFPYLDQCSTTGRYRGGLREKPSGRAHSGEHVRGTHDPTSAGPKRPDCLRSERDKTFRSMYSSSLSLSVCAAQVWTTEITRESRHLWTLLRSLADGAVHAEQGEEQEPGTV
jgi:hypothetical protein